MPPKIVARGTSASSLTSNVKLPSMVLVLPLGAFCCLMTDFSQMTEAEKEAAIHSARYILDDAYTPEGIKALARITGFPEGVISEALANILK
jgi:hypothetical protein